MSAAPLSESIMNTTPVAAPSSAPGSAEPAVTNMHQGNLTPLEIQRQLLQKKLAEKQDSSFTSPTDQMMTPCSKKLQDHKKKALGRANLKPKSLTSRFSSLKAMADNNNPGKENKSSGLGI